MPDSMPSIGKTGNASIDKLGHTNLDRHGRNPYAQAKGNLKPTEQKAKG
jgi:hypothetical protein